MTNSAILRKKNLTLLLPALMLLIILISLLYKFKRPNKYASLPIRKVNTKIPVTLINLDTVLRNSHVSGSFKMYNIDTWPLKIMDIYPDCTCTKYEISKKRIFAGDSVEVKLTFDYSDHDHGYFQHSVRIESNAHRDPIILAIRGFLK